MDKLKVYKMSFNKIYQCLLDKVYKKERTKSEVDEVIFWLTGYDENSLNHQIEKEVDMETFFTEAPHMNPKRKEIKGVICGYRVEDIEDEILQNIRYLDKLIDELATGKSMDKILRK